jgi:hypothetical protein
VEKSVVEIKTRRNWHWPGKEANHVKVHAILAVVFVLFTLAIGCTSEHKETPVAREADSSGKQVKETVTQVDSTSLKNTLITSHMEEKITPGKNLIYCNTFQIAWNELKDNIIKEDIRLTDEPAIVKFLNKSLSTKADISEDCYVAMVGFSQEGILAKVNKALKQKFGDEAPVVDDLLAEDSIFAYAFLYKNLRFKVAFENLKAPLSFTSSDGRVAKLRAFGIRNFSHREKYIKMSAQVRILDYKNESDFIIRLKSTSPSDEIILAKVKSDGTLLATIEAVQARVESGRSGSLDPGETLQIPKFDFDLKHLYSELRGRSFKNKGFEKYGIDYAIQTIRFKLDEKGTILKSEARISVPCESPMKPRRLIFDRPFLLYLKEKGAKYPYFAMWVGNAELLVKE